MSQGEFHSLIFYFSQVCLQKSEQITLQMFVTWFLHFFFSIYGKKMFFIIFLFEWVNKMPCVMRGLSPCWIICNMIRVISLCPPPLSISAWGHEWPCEHLQWYRVEFIRCCVVWYLNHSDVLFTINVLNCKRLVSFILHVPVLFDIWTILMYFIRLMY